MADNVLEKTAITLDDLLAAKAQVEIINGEMVEMAAAGGTHHLIGGNVYRAVDGYTVQTGTGTAFFDGMTYLMFSDARWLKHSFVPDVSVLRHENILKDWVIDKPYPGVPDFAAEIVSPGDDADEVLGKVRTYLAKGTEEVWVIYPAVKEVHQYRKDAPEKIRAYGGTQKIDSPLFPGLDLTPDMIFKLPPWAIKEE